MAKAGSGFLARHILVDDLVITVLIFMHGVFSFFHEGVPAGQSSPSAASFVRLKPLAKAEHKLGLEVEFRTLAMDGVLFYAGQSADGTGDFVALTLRNGFVEFRFELGSGIALLRSSKRVTLGEWHRLSAKRYHGDGILRLDDASPVSGRAPGSLRSLDVLQPAFVGAIPPIEDLQGGELVSEIILSEQLNLPLHAAGLRGCVKKFSLGHREIKLQAPSEPLAERRQGLDECGRSPCEGEPCSNEGTCQASVDGSYFTCKCGKAFTGVRCETLAGEEAEEDVCASVPCLGGGKCSSLPGGDFQCQCPPGLGGKRCEIQGENRIEVSISMTIFLQIIPCLPHPLAPPPSSCPPSTATRTWSCPP